MELQASLFFSYLCFVEGLNTLLVSHQANAEISVMKLVSAFIMAAVVLNCLLPCAMFQVLKTLSFHEFSVIVMLTPICFSYCTYVELIVLLELHRLSS